MEKMERKIWRNKTITTEITITHDIKIKEQYDGDEGKLYLQITLLINYMMEKNLFVYGE